MLFFSPKKMFYFYFQEEIYLAVYNTRSAATNAREKLDGYDYNDSERLIVKFDGDKK